MKNKLNAKENLVGGDLQVFNCNLGKIRVIVKDNIPYFMASDLCTVLEYKNDRDTINRLLPKGVAKYYIVTNGGKQLGYFLLYTKEK